MRVRTLGIAACAALLIPLISPGAAGAKGYTDGFFHPAPTGEPGDVLNSRKEFLPLPGAEVDQMAFRSTNSYDESTVGAATFIRPPCMCDNVPEVNLVGAAVGDFPAD